MTTTYFNLLKNVFLYGKEVKTRGLKTRELLFQTLDVTTYNAFGVENIRDWSEISKYLFAEIAWYMTGDRTLDKIRPYSKFWDTIKNPDGKINSNYGDLVFYRLNGDKTTSFSWALRKLIEDKYTRKAIILYNDREFFFDDNKDLICNQYQQFFIRDNVLHCGMTLRSSDMIYGLTFNIPWWSFVHQLMFLCLKEYYPDLKCGFIKAFLGSVHIYENKFDLVEDMLNGKKQLKQLVVKDVLYLFNNFEFYHQKLKEIIEVRDVHSFNTRI